MTTVACNKTSMAGDLQITINQNLKLKGGSKVYKIKAHQFVYDEDFLVGFCGNSASCLDVLDYYRNPELYKTAPKVKNVGGLVLTESGKIYTFYDYLRWTEVDATYAAVGSGDMVAMGAMANGATPEEAINIASQFCPYTGMGVSVLSFE